MPDSPVAPSSLFSPIDGHPLRLADHVHPFVDLLELGPDQILERFRDSQREDFLKVIRSPELTGFRLIEGDSGAGPENLPTGQTLEDLFLDLHDHVMSHPVWIHPFFVRVFSGDFNLEQLKEFSLHYFNQIKNTRQCVALSLGRFSGFSDKRHGIYSEKISELTQIVLSQLIADEYGVSTHEVESYPTLAGIFQSTTHIVMYRQLFEGLDIPFVKQDVPMSHGVADNVAVQRILAGNPAFSELESLASVGLGMEWGVPEFFSLLLGGFLRFIATTGAPLNERHLLVFIAHVKYDVMHAISVMYVTAMHMHETSDLEKVKNATNTLMASRYGMMTDLYRRVFGEDPGPVEFENRHKLTDHRIEDELIRLREKAADGTVENIDSYRKDQSTPFQFL